MNDRNKTQLTHDVTQAVGLWMDGHGFKPVETEVPICLGWCADLAGVIVPTQTELIALKMIPRAPKWQAYDGEKYEGPSEAYIAWERRRDDLLGAMTCLVEVKTSRGDFLGDKKWDAALPTDLAFLAFQKGLIAEEEWPQRWGILQFSPDGGIRLLRDPYRNQISMEQNLSTVLAIAVRRDHHTRYARWREIQKQQRVEEGERKAFTRIGDIARFLIRVARGEGESLERLMLFSSVSRELPEWVMESVKELWGLARERSGGVEQ